MALFFNRRRSRQPVIVVRHRPRLSPFMKRLTVLCQSADVHPLPVMMNCIAESTSDNGSPMAVYACPFHGCRQGWVQDRFTAKPRRLWAGKHDGR